MNRAPASAAPPEVERIRLLSRLPDAPGFVVHLRAPYGFGKTWLARAHLRRMAADGWRALDVAVDGRGLGSALAAALGLPGRTAPAALCDALWETRDSLWETGGAHRETGTVLFLDDLGAADERDPVLERVLKEPRGAVLLASRGRFVPPQFARLGAEGRLLTLDATDLAFDAVEATVLFGGAAAPAAAALERYGGWPLLLANSASSGAGPDAALMTAAAENALERSAWEALLLLAAVPDAGEGLLGVGGAELLASGLASADPRGVQPIRMLTTACLSARRTEALEVVARCRGRLSAMQLALAYERLGDPTELARVIDEADAPLAREDPRAVLRWYGLIGDAEGGVARARRRMLVGNALAAVGRASEGGYMLEALAAETALPADLRLQALGDAIYLLAGEPAHHAKARELLEASTDLAASASAERRGLFFSTASVLDFRTGDPAAAKRLVERALRELPPDNPLRFGPLINLAILSWNLEGDLEGRIRLQESCLELCRAHYPDHVVGVCRDLAHLSLYLGRTERARAYLAEARRFGASRPLFLLDVEAMSAALEGDLARLRELATAAGGCGDPGMADAVTWRYLTALRHAAGMARVVEAEQSLRPLGPFGTVALALALLDAGEPAAAEELLEGVRPEEDEREFRLEWSAARYRVTRDEAELDHLIGLTMSGAAILPALLPLGSLPRHRPELARPYPLADVLRSGWRQAAEARADEVPPLEVEYLGRTVVTVLGEAVEVVGRPRDVLAMLLLRVGRREIGATLWPESDRTKVRNNLSVQYSLLRRVLEPWGTRRYLPEDALEHTGADVWRLEQALRARDADAALTLYRGPFAPLVDVPAVVDARTRLERAMVDLLVERAATAHADRAVHYLRRALEIDPLDEGAVQALLGRLVAAGRAGEAEQRYRRFEADLRRELGTEPRAETRAVLAR